MSDRTGKDRTGEDRNAKDRNAKDRTGKDGSGGHGDGPERDAASEADEGAHRSEEPEKAGDRESGGDEPTDEGERRPISVRDLMPPPSARPQRRQSEEERGRQRRRRSKGGEESVPGAGEVEVGEEVGTEPDAEVPAAESRREAGGGGAGTTAHPTPVREAMDRTATTPSPSTEELPSRTFESEGEEWTVRIDGRSLSGTRPDAGALLMHLAFFRAPDLDSPRRELLTVDRPLNALYDEDLRELLARSRPARNRDDDSSA